MAQAYYSPYTINAAQVPTTQTDFPVLVSVTDARLKTIANGGHVADGQGDDIRPYTDTTLATPITGYEKVFYDATNGILEMWVKVASLSSSTTPIVLGYGDAALTSDASSTTTWSNGFVAVYHLKDGTTLSVADSLNAFNGTNSGATAAAGKIDGGAGFVSASNQFITCSPALVTAFTYSAWINATSFPNSYNTVIGQVNAGVFKDMYVKSNGKMACSVRATGTVVYDGTGSNTLSAGTWYYVGMTYDSSGGLKGYVNAGVDGTAAANGAAGSSSTTEIGRDPVSTTLRWNGTIDEVRMASVVRVADWITTEYNNQSAPATFATLGTEVAVSAATRRMFFVGGQ